ncbi:HAMP domain-containing sensor histidine kinase [Lysinibacillus xylanilyticus]|uniref:histidine kinase n=1 Tax=Lysinibacillus xylanilyticus TaxID=582475 RepID=A0ABT4ET06_9BACI|nr:HAMP domain-containing sensor histidine kinase [Lysinibacillus xylanilyticus]MCY9548765.1 HAMP domain-containing histidine kinase [Lysinibacillus xylanilyticus]
MTIKNRFLTSYIGGIIIASVSILSILCIVFYVTTGSVPTPKILYKTFTKQRSLSPEEELAYVELRNIAKHDPDKLLVQDTQKKMQQIEEKSLEVIIRHEEEIVYYSEGLVEKSLVVHFPMFDTNNIETKGTIDNAGGLYRYIKFDFYYSDKSKGSVLVLKKENSFLEFLTKWGIIIIFFILLVSIAAMLFLNQLLHKTIINPLENLGQTMSEIKEGDLMIKAPTMPANTAREVHELTANFESMRSALLVSIQEQRNLEKNRKDLIASISHDLKTPITTIIGYVEGLQEGVAETPEKREKYLNTIHSKSLALNRLIEELFLYSKFDAEAVHFDFERIQLAKFLTHIVEEFQLYNREVQLELNVVEDVYVHIDRMQMNRAVTNLIENSMKFKKPTEPLCMILEVEVVDDLVEIVIKDNGQGISELQLPYVFDHFYRGEEARTSTTGGSGLGLAIVKQIVEKHDGHVKIQSKLNYGTTVTIILGKA